MRFKKVCLIGRTPVYLFFCCQFRCSWIRIRIPNTNPDPGQPHECVSGSISQRHGSVDPDPHQNVMDPEHCLEQQFYEYSPIHEIGWYRYLL
jgi:hypothetical protein